jgi:hypothetical protein
MSQARHDTLIHETRRSVRLLAAQAAAGTLTPEQFGDRMAELLEGAHTQAVVIGRQHAGDRAPEEEDDRKFGVRVVDSEAEFLAGFVADLERGRYTDPETGDVQTGAVQQRALLYAGRVSGTANEAWGLSQETDAGLVWNLGASDHCADCPGLAAGSPYTPASLPTWPRMSGTACLSNCTCTVTADGAEGFQATES